MYLLAPVQTGYLFLLIYLQADIIMAELLHPIPPVFGDTAPFYCWIQRLYIGQIQTTLIISITYI